MKALFLASAWVKPAERMRAGAGALLGLAALGVIAGWLSGRLGVPVALVAPLGASSVLLFAVPSSPLAQPWSVIGGNALSGLVGLGVALFIPSVPLAAGLAVGVAIAVMASARCLHPPGGAVALTMVLLGFRGVGEGLSFLIWNVGLTSLLLVVIASAFHGMSGHTYPEFLKKPEAPPLQEDGAAESAIIEDVLRSSEEIVDISSVELQKIYHRISLRMAMLHRDARSAGDLMTVAPEALSPGLSLTKAFDEVARRAHHTAFVTDENARLIGVVTLADFVDYTDLRGETIRVNARRRLENAAALRSAPAQIVGDIMRRDTPAVSKADPLSQAVMVALESRLPLVPVVDDKGRLSGVVPPERLMAALAAP